MTTLRIKTNAASVSRWLTASVVRKIDQAGAKALSQTVLQVQKAERIELHKRFTIRRSTFMDRRIKVMKFAKPNSLTAIIGIDDKVQGSALILGMFEDGGQKQPMQGNRVAVPITGTKARRAFKNRVNAYRMDKLGLKKKGGQVQGAKRTFIVPTKKGDFALMQRDNKGITPLYIFRKNVKVRARLPFTRIATDLAVEQVPKLFNRYLQLYIKP